MALTDKIEVQVFSKLDPTKMIEVLNGAIETTVLEELRGLSGGTTSVSISDPKILANPKLLDYRNFFRIKINGKTVGAFVAKKRKTDVVGKSADVEVYTFSGGGPLEWLKDASVYPERGLKATSYTGRSFNFSSKIGAWYDPAKWQNVVSVLGLYPKGLKWEKWPQRFPRIPGIKWIWSEPGVTEHKDQRVGYNYLRGTFNITNPGKHQLVFGADDMYKLYVDGQLIAGTELSGSGFRVPQQYEFDFEAGEHVIGLEIFNFGGPAGLIAALYRGDYENEEDTTSAEYVKNLVWATGRDNAMWKVLPYPKDPPGWTAGEVMLTLIDEAKARGIKSMTWLTPTFTAQLDSNGKPWDTLYDWTFSVGSDLYTVIDKIQELTCEAWVDPETLELHMAQNRGTDRSAYQFSAQTQLVNSFLNPNGVQTSYLDQTGNGVRRFAAIAGANHSYREIDRAVNDFQAKNVSIFTRQSNQKASFGFEVPWKTAGRSVSVQFKIKSQVATSITLWAMPNARRDEVTRTQIGTSIALAANTVTTISRTFTTPATEPDGSATSYVVVESLTGTAGQTFELGDVLVVLDNTATNHTFWSGSSANSNTVTHAWTGEVDNSPSTRTTGVVAGGAIVLQRGKDLAKATIDGVGDIKNLLLVRTEDGWFERKGGSFGEFGRIEGKLDTNANTRLSERIADEVFKQRSLPDEAASYVFTETDGQTPFVNFNVGDWLIAPDSSNRPTKRRVVSISAGDDINGTIAYDIEFDSVRSSTEEKVQKWISRDGGGAIGLGFSNAGSGADNPQGRPVIVEPNIPLQSFPQAPASLSGTSTAEWDPQGLRAVAKVVLTWLPVVANVDGSITEPAYYEVELATVAAEVPRVVATVEGTTATIENLPVSQLQKFRVRAFNSPEEAGEYSAWFELTTPIPNTPMSAPDAPTLQSKLGVVVVNWNGLLNGNIPPKQFRYVYSEFSLDGGTTYTRMGPSFFRDTRSVTVAGSFTVGSTVRVRLRAVDGLEIISNPSTMASIVVDGVAGADLTEEIQDKIDEAYIQAGDVSDRFDALDLALDGLSGITTGEKIVNINERLDENINFTTALSVRGENLIINGSGETGDLTNWESEGIQLAPARAPQGFPNAFESTSAVALNPFADQYITVDPSQTYKMQATFLGKAGMRHYLALRPIDADGYGFPLQYANRVSGTETTLAAPLAPGATTVTLTDGSGWPTTTASSAYLAWWPYVNGKGQTFNPADGYTRNLQSIGVTSRSGNVLTLGTAWTGEALPAGKVVTLNYSGASYIYPNFKIMTSDVEVMDGTIGGISNGLHGQQAGKFWPGTTKVQPGFLLNNGSLVNDGTKPGFTGFRFENDMARQVALIAQATANGRNRVFTSLSNATGTADSNGVPFINGDIWWKKTSLTAAGTVTGQWTFQGSSWVATEFSQETIASINFDKGIFGTLDGIYLRANTVSVKTLLVSDFTNLVENGEIAVASSWLDSGTLLPAAATFYNLTDRELSFTTARTNVSNVNLVPVLPGEKFYISADVRSIGTVAGTVGGFRIRNQANAEVGSTTVTPTSTKTRYGWEFTVPASGTTHIRLRYATALTGGEIRVGNITMRRVNGGELIVDGAIVGRHVQAGTITAEKVVLSNASSLIPWNIKETTNPHTAFSGTAISSANDPDVGWCMQLTGGTGTDGTYGSAVQLKSGTVGRRNVDGDFAVEPGATYRFRMGVGAGGVFPAGANRLLRVVFAAYRLDGTYSWLYSTTVTNPPFVKSTSFPAALDYIDCQITVPTDVVDLRPYVQKSTWSDGSYFITEPLLVRAASAELIVDGSITTSKIFAGAVTTNSLAARAVSAEKMLIGDFTNLMENADFESASATFTADPNTGVEGWTLLTGAVTVANTSGLPGRGIYFTGLGEAAVTNNRFFEVTPSLQPPVYGPDGTVEHPATLGMPEFYLQAKARIDRANPSYLSITWYDLNKVAIATSDLPLTTTPGTTYNVFSGTTGQDGIGAVPEEARFGRISVYTDDVTTNASAWIGNLVVRRKNGAELIVDGSIYGKHLRANTIESRHLRTGSVMANHIEAGQISVGHVDALFGSELSISGNVTIQAISSDITNARKEASDALAEQAAVYRFDADAAKIARVGSPYQVWVSNDRISIYENNEEVSWWNSGQLHVKDAVLERVILVKHQLESTGDGTGTVVRAI